MKITIIRNKNDMIIYRVDYKNINRKTKFVNINEFYLSKPNIFYILKSDSNNKISEYIIRNYKKNKKKDNSMRNITFLSIGLIIVAIFFPIILGLITNADNIIVNTSNSVNPSILTLLIVLIPIIAIVAILLFFFPKVRGKN